MTDTKELLRKISALRQRLDQAQGIVKSATDELLGPAGNTPHDALRAQVEAGAYQTAALETCVKQLPETYSQNDAPHLPTHLTARSVRLVKCSRDLLHKTRQLGEDPLLQDDDSALTDLHRAAVAMLDSTLRTLQAFPSAPSAQTRLCEGLEAAAQVVENKLHTLEAGLLHRRKEQSRLESLMHLLKEASSPRPLGFVAFLPLANAILNEARQGAPLRFFSESPARPVRFIAAHALTVAQVTARLLLGDPEWQGRLQDAIVTALVHNVGLLQVPESILQQSTPLDDAQRRQLERHPFHGADVAARLWPGGGWTVEAIADHHERIDGTGYPAGKKDLQISSFAKILAVADAYTAICCPRPYRPARDTRTSLTESLLLAEQGVLDRNQAERLLKLSFYPVGSSVELSDGSFAVVVATHSDTRGISQPHKPIVHLLADAEGRPTPFPVILDLLHDERSVLRTLPAEDRRQLLGSRYPELA